MADSFSKRQLHPRRQLQPAGQLRHLLGDMRLDAVLRLVEGGDDEILEDLDLVGIDERLVDLDPPQIALAADRHLDEPAAGGAGHLDGLELRLHLGHLGLHLLRLLHHLPEILHATSSPSLASSASAVSAGAPAGGGSSRTVSMVAPGNASRTARTIGCSAASLRKWRVRWSACSRRLGAPASRETLTTQRAPVQVPSNWPRRFGRSRGAASARRNSMRPGSKWTRWQCDHRCERSTASRWCSNSATTSVKLCGCGGAFSAGAGTACGSAIARGAASAIGCAA